MRALPAQDDAGRRLLHTREVVCKGYVRTDGLYDIEGRMVDLSAEGTWMIFHELAPGEAIHDLRLVLTIDAELTIHRAQAFMETTATPYCGGAAAAYGQLVGLRIGPGFRQAAKERVGDVAGCTHLTELLGPMGTTAMQTLFSQRREARRRDDTMPEQPMPRPSVVGTCHAYRMESPATAVIWPPEKRQV
ncbi:hypothetical protein D9M68_522150 [compost metagenome]|uniref:DUF2889 domain-containing protein n=1 Tax=Variovorax boronicumulans TaxID=436515 RepID=UPI000BB3A951|nr:DUF2889 domain-containing protein [Variovorax boronicumulans]PBI95777.1 hypothetical protein BKP43_00850 [Variovorax boronicumulans]